MLLVAEAGRAAFDGRLDEAERMTEEALALNRRHGDDCFQEHTVGRLVLARLRWRPQDADAAQLRGFAARYPHLPVWEAMLASLEWELGNVEAARRGVALCARDDFAAVAALARLPARRAVPRRGRRGRRRAVAGRAAVRAAGSRTRDANPVLEHLWAIWGPVARALGLLAAADDRPQDAAAHFADALRLAEAWGAPGWELRVDRRLAGDRRPGRRTARSSSAAGCRSRASSALPGVAARIADEAQTITP